MKKAHKLVVIACAILMLAAYDAQAQTTKVDVHYSTASLDSLFIVNQQNNYNKKNIDGYRIQIYSGSGVAAKKEALDSKVKFLSQFPNEKVYVVYSAPFWRVRIGDYRFRSEAMTLLGKVKRQFPGSYTVKDNSIRKKNFK